MEITYKVTVDTPLEPVEFYEGPEYAEALEFFEKVKTFDPELFKPHFTKITETSEEVSIEPVEPIEENDAE